MSSQQILVFSDLDGTLLDHYDYQANAAKQTLEHLSDANIPVILNTSKTLVEVEVIQQQLQLSSPFIVENGAAIYIPIGTFTKQPNETETKGDYWIKSFSSPREHWLNLLSVHATEFTSKYQGFSSLSIAEISQLTGLTNEAAKRAKTREFAEPINWLGDDSSKKYFIEKLIDAGANVVQGGRFIHVGGYCDKGQAMIWLAEQYREHCTVEQTLTIALGDGENDTSMLEAADFAIQVRSPVHPYPKLMRQFKTMQTELFGPEGWSDAIEKLLYTKLSPTKKEVNYG
ncbi:MAG: HAD-IIB family hydrolase [Colwellia sp.]